MGKITVKLPFLTIPIEFRLMKRVTPVTYLANEKCDNFRSLFLFSGFRAAFNCTSLVASQAPIKRRKKITLMELKEQFNDSDDETLFLYRNTRDIVLTSFSSFVISFAIHQSDSALQLIIL